jgi:hypothetical protein
MGIKLECFYNMVFLHDILYSILSLTLDPHPFAYKNVNNFNHSASNVIGSKAILRPVHQYTLCIKISKNISAIGRYILD